MALCLLSPDLRNILVLPLWRPSLQLARVLVTLMEGGETEAMFQRGNCRARVAYLNGSDQLNMPPVELIQFVGDEVAHKAADLFTTSISELCFYADDADAVYQKLMEQGAECLSSPQEFDFRHDGFGRSRAFYFRDPDGIILEIMQPLDD